jgi:hypothetical protein
MDLSGLEYGNVASCCLHGKGFLGFRKIGGVAGRGWFQHLPPSPRWAGDTGLPVIKSEAIRWLLYHRGYSESYMS